MKEHVEFMMKIQSNPYYPVPIDQYPKLFDFVMTPNGMTYFERLKKEYDLGNNMSQSEKLYLALLYLSFATLKKSVKDCQEWQEFMFSIGQSVDLDKSGVKETLQQMGCIIDNPEYSPKLYKSHIIWKNNILSVLNTDP